MGKIVASGNTLKLMKLLRKYSIDKMLIDAYNDDKVMCGVSAGGICWCDWGNSDSEIISKSGNRMIRVKGLGIIHILFAPHIVTESNRAESVKKMMKRTPKVPAIGLDNSALEIIDNKYRVLTNDNNSVAQKCYYKNGEYITKNIISSEFKEIEELYERH